MFQPRIKLIDDLTNAVVAEATANGTASISFANGSSNKAYSLVLSSQVAASAGPYTLEIDINYVTTGAPSAITSPLSLPLLSTAIAHDAAISRRESRRGARYQHLTKVGGAP